MYDLEQIKRTVLESVGSAENLSLLIHQLRANADGWESCQTTSKPVAEITPALAVGSLTLHAEDGWEGTFGILLTYLFDDVFSDNPEEVMAQVWTRRADGQQGYEEYVGFVDSDSIGSETITFRDGVVVDREGVVAVRI